MAIALRVSFSFLLLGTALGLGIQQTPTEVESREVREHRERKLLEDQLLQESLQIKALKEKQLKEEAAIKEAHAQFREDQRLRDAEALAVRKRTIHRLEEQQEKENGWRANQAHEEEVRVESTAKKELLKRAVEIREQVQISSRNLTKGSLTDKTIDGISMVDLVETLNGAAKSLKDPSFLRSVDDLAEVWESAIAAVSVHSKQSLSKFVMESSPSEVTHESLAKSLFRFVDRSHQLIESYREGASSFADGVSRMRGSQDIISLFAPVAKLEALPVHLVEDTANAMDFACAKASALVSSLSPVYKNLTKMRRSLNSTAKISTIVDTLVPDSPKDLNTMAQKITDVALMSTIAMEDTARDIISKAGPILLTKYKCTWSAAGPRSFLSVGLFAMLASLAAGLL